MVYKEVADQSVVEFDEKIERDIQAGLARDRYAKGQKRDKYLHELMEKRSILTKTSTRK